MYKDQQVLSLLKDNHVTFNILDIGASGEPYRPFERIKNVAKIFLTDPDSREFESSKEDGKTRIPKAIIDNDVDNDVKLYLTKSPFCSSTLEPDFSRLNNFTYPHLFEVERTINLPATSINRVVKEYNIEGFDWIKLDTQGTELKILKSLKPEYFSKLLCIDLEIGLYPHYFNADTMPSAHEFLEKDRFWISGMRTQNRIRMRKKDLDEIINSRKHLRRIIRRSLETYPTTFEVRYLRSINQGTEFKAEYALKLWALNYFTGNFSYCFYLSNMLNEKYPSPLAQKVKKISEDLVFSYRRIFQQLAANAMHEIKRRMW